MVAPSPQAQQAVDQYAQAASDYERILLGLLRVGAEAGPQWVAAQAAALDQVLDRMQTIAMAMIVLWLGWELIQAMRRVPGVSPVPADLQAIRVLVAAGQERMLLAHRGIASRAVRAIEHVAPRGWRRRAIGRAVSTRAFDAGLSTEQVATEIEDALAAAGMTFDRRAPTGEQVRMVPVQTRSGKPRMHRAEPYALMVARTQGARAREVGTQLAARRAGYRGLRIVGRRDDAHCAAHVGRTYPVDVSPEVLPPYHPQCMCRSVQV